jgi:hypothetical protein
MNWLRFAHIMYLLAPIGARWDVGRRGKERLCPSKCLFRLHLKFRNDTKRKHPPTDYSHAATILYNTWIPMELITQRLTSRTLWPLL